MNEYEQKIAQAENAMVQEHEESMQSTKIGEAEEKKEKKAADKPTELQQIQIDKTRAVQLQASKYFDPVAYAHFKTMAQDFINAGALSADVKTPEQMILKFQAGSELGLAPVESLNSLYIVSGRISFWGAALIRRLRLFGWQIAFKEQEDECEATITKGNETYTDKMTYAEAEASGYTRSMKGPKIGWNKGTNRKLKLRYGALSTLVKTYVPEVLGSAAGVTEIDMIAQVEENKDDQKKEMEKKITERMKQSALDTNFKPVIKGEK